MIDCAAMNADMLSRSHGCADAAVPSGQTFAQSVLISAVLAYLAIPNILFLFGWFTPWVALLTSLLIIAAVGHAAIVSFRGLRCHRERPRHAFSMCIALGLATLLCFFFLIHWGLLGWCSSHPDLSLLRNAMFANLRDAAWPLILPNGKEMSYYLANILPPALLARLMPSTGQWAVVLWTLPAMLMSLLLLGSCRGVGNFSVLSHSCGGHGKEYLKGKNSLSEGCA